MNVFLVGHNATTLDDPMNPETTFHVITRQKSEGPFLFQKLPEVCRPFGLNRKPPYYFLQRLKDFPPNIQDVVVVASTASGDIGLFSRAKTPLTSDFPPERITNVFTTTTIANDARRAQLPMNDNMEDTSPIGAVIDLSAKEKVLRPLPGEEMDSSPGPVPALMTLNTEGLLSAWWIIYADSIRQGTTFPGLVSQDNQTPSQPQTSTQPTAFGSTSGQPVSTSGQNALGVATPTGFGGTNANKSSTSIFGGANAADSSAPSAFGSPAASAASPWTSSGFSSVNAQNGTSSFGKPSFGNASTIGGSAATPAFGSAGGIGNRGSVWGGASPGTAQPGGSISGQSAGLGMRAGSAFGASGPSGTFGTGSSPTPSQGGFASFAKGSGFLSAASQGGGESPFAKGGTGATFSSTMDTDISFGGIPQKKADIPNTFLSSSAFSLGSTFTKDHSGPPDLPKPAKGTQNSLFGAGLGRVLGEVQEEAPQARSEETDMAEDDSDLAGSESSEEPPADSATRTPAAKQAQPRGGIGDTTTPKFSGLFGTQSQTKTTPAAVQSSTPAPSIFDKVHPPTTTPAETPQRQQESSPLTAQTPPSPPVKPEPDDQETPVGVSKSIPEAPLPPESTSKVSYAPGDSSNSSKSSAEDAPLPPDFNPSKTKLHSVQKPPVGSPASPADDNDAPLSSKSLPSKAKPKIVERQASQEPPLPADDGDGGLDDEGSGVDVAQEVSPVSDPAQSPRITPGSSFGASFGPSPVSSVFNKPQQPRQNVRSLFGEVPSPNVPILPPPSRTQQSPRSPSPVRLVPPVGTLRPENARSISAPNRPPVPVAQQRAGKPSVRLTPAALPTAKEQRQKERDTFAARRARQQAEEQQDLSDREDERVREELETEVEPTKTLDDFLAHQDYIGSVTKPGIPGQIEKVYRDINSMVDTLGLNARALQGFVKGHQTMAKDGGRSLGDLDDPDWCLAETEDLGILESQLQDQLDEGRIPDVQEKLNICRNMRRDLSRLRTRRADIAKVLNASEDEEKVNAIKCAPLSASQIQQQHDLRKGYTKVQKLIAEAEGNITLLRANLAAHDKGNDKAAPLKKPTVEAVTNTIHKMTSMVEKKSGDIDFLEAQMRKLRFSSGGRYSSREGSPLAAAPPGVKNPRPSTLRSLVPGAVESSNSKLRRSTGEGGTPRKRMSGVSAEEVERYRTKMERREEVNRIMHETFAKTGPRIQRLE